LAYLINLHRKIIPYYFSPGNRIGKSIVEKKSNLL